MNVFTSNGRLAAVLFTVMWGAAAAEPLPIDRIFAGPPLSGEAAGGVRMSPDGRLVGYLAAAPDNPEAPVIWVMPASGGPKRIALDPRTLAADPGTMSEAAIRAIERRHQSSGDPIDYSWSQDGRNLLVAWDGNLYLAPVDAGPPRQLTRAHAWETDPQLSPDGRSVSFVRENNLVLRDIAAGSERALGSDASESVIYGAPDFITQEELQRFTGTWWSPDSSRIAYTRTDESRVTRVAHVRVDEKGFGVVQDRFPLAGTANSDVQIFVARRDGQSAPVKVDLGPTADIYIYQVAWSDDGSTLYVERQSRDQKRLDLLAADPATGASRVLVSETSSTWVDLELNFRPLRGGYFLWGSSRTGWRHLYLYDRNGTLVRPVTAGPWRVASIDISDIPGQTPIVGVDEDRKQLYFIASIDTPLEQQLYSVSYAHPDTPHPVTSGHGWWQPMMAQGHPTAFVGRYSEPRLPPQLGLYDLKGRRIAWLAENRLDASHPMFPYLDQSPTYEDGVIKAADGQDLHYLLIKPAGFDPHRRYPALIRAYGGPQVQTVRREWHSVTDQLFTQAGYVMFRLDNRGSGNRSEAFEHAIAGHFGEMEVADQITGARFLRALPFVDPDRIGMFGSSFGGYVGARAVMTNGSGIRAAVASSTPAEWLGYDTHYTEQYLGQPKDNAAGYDAAALLPLAKTLQGKLMLMHGVSDDNVSFSNFTSLVTALETEGKTFEMSIFPEQGHVFMGAAAQARALGTSLDFFQRTLAPAAAHP